MKKKSPKKSAAPVKKVKKASVKKKPVTKTKAAKKSFVKKSAKKASAVKKKVKRKPETLMCFLTTACVHYYGLADDGYELNTLRQYRDTYLASSVSGKKMIKTYYEISPRIVRLIEKDTNKKSVYAYIYSEVKFSCAAIELKEFELARKIYSSMVKTLQKKYLLN